MGSLGKTEESLGRLGWVWDGMVWVRTYSVVASRVLRPNQVFHVAVSSHGTEGDVQVSAEVGGEQDSGNIILLRQIADLQPDSTQVLKFEVCLILLRVWFV
ncbi:hypothetical protein E2C01_061163 [Portunus trituberculatus]|uniref:Uncharacterized protein n=1 Tax=Portunus trituberculatus TaxID=210409 RepID=A0A5B7HA03_PORTR|nr:hypothetical protein [Portunus trituberculatus]